MLLTFTFYQLRHARSTIIRPSLEPTRTYQESSYYIEVASDIAMRDPAALRRQVNHPESSVDINIADSSPEASLASRASPEPEITEMKVRRDRTKAKTKIQKRHSIEISEDKMKDSKYCSLQEQQCFRLCGTKEVS
jgi:hypothetical protein